MLYQPQRERKERENKIFIPCCLRLKIVSSHLIKKVPMSLVERPVPKVRISSQYMKRPLFISCTLLFILQVYRQLPTWSQMP